MFDLLFTYQTKSDAEAALADWVMTDEETGTKHWSPAFPACGINHVEVVLQDAVWDSSDPENPVLVTPRIVSDTYWLNIAIPADGDKGFVPNVHGPLVSQLEAIPGWQATINRPDTPTPAAECIVRTGLTPEQLGSMVRIDGIPAGGRYIF